MVQNPGFLADKENVISLPQTDRVVGLEILDWCVPKRSRPDMQKKKAKRKKKKIGCLCILCQGFVMDWPVVYILIY